MNCQNCGKSNACVHLTDIIDGEKRTRVLCEKCAGELGFVIDPKLIQAATTHLQKMIAPLVLTSQTSAQDQTQASTAVCPNCGMTWSEFRKGNRFGCPQDYDLFVDELDEILLEVQGHTRHKGRLPAHLEALMTREERVVGLREQMEDAVQHEAFEDAARLRDAIIKLESGSLDDAPAS